MGKQVFLIVLAILLAIPNFLKKDINEVLPYNKIEQFQPELSEINNIDKLEEYIDATAKSKKIATNHPEYPQLVSQVIANRFYHGFAHWKLNENWIAAVGEKFTGIGLSCKVQPDAILKSPNAACSQQALVMMNILRKKNIPYRKVGFPHHYALEANVNGTWYYFDPNMEPSMNLLQRVHENWKEQNDSLKSYYNTAMHKDLAYQFGTGQTAIFGEVNEIPAKNLRFFQRVTGFFSNWLWVLPLLLLPFVGKRKQQG